MRVKLINLSAKKGYSISRAAREIGIKPSTGKFIVKSFRDQGKIMKKMNLDGTEANIDQIQEIVVSKNDLPFKRKKSKKNVVEKKQKVFYEESEKKQCLKYETENMNGIPNNYITFPMYDQQVQWTVYPENQ